MISGRDSEASLSLPFHEGGPMISGRDSFLTVEALIQPPNLYWPG